jgi:hypothetical protein
MLLFFFSKTAGGLLAGVPADLAEACCKQLIDAGYLDTCVIGISYSVICRLETPLSVICPLLFVPFGNAGTIDDTIDESQIRTGLFVKAEFK